MRKKSGNLIKMGKLKRDPRRTPKRWHAVFPTAIGVVGIAWSDDGLVALQLPERDERATSGSLARRAASVPGVPPLWVRQIMREVEAHLGGELSNFSGVPVDLKGVPPFHQRVYEILRQVGPGRMASYSEIATACGDSGAARAVGQAMGKNPLPLIIPCHRVVAVNGTGGFSAPGGISTKARLLAIEGVNLESARGAKTRDAARRDSQSREVQGTLPL